MKKLSRRIYTAALYLAAFSTHADQFGFQYWPYADTTVVYSKCLYDANWTNLNAQVESDLDHIASLGGNYIRFHWKTWSSLINNTSSTNHIRTELSEQTNNVVELLQLLDERNLKIIIALENDLLNNDAWQTGWPNDQSGFFADCLTVYNAIISACENSSYADTVLFYDLENEVQPPDYDFAIYAYDYANAPAAKRGFSIGQAITKSQQFHDTLTTNRPLAYADFHSYTDNPQSNVTASVPVVRAAFSNATVIMGEFGANLDLCYDDEPLQMLENADRIDAALQTQLAWYSIWSYVDRNGANPFGALATPDDPRDTMGLISDLFGLARNPDFESATAGLPDNWSCWQSGGDPMVFWRINDVTKSACGSGYARIALPAGSVSAKIQISSDKFDIPAGAERLYLNSFIQANQWIDYAQMTVKQFNSSGQQVAWNGSPQFNSPGWGWKNFLHNVGSWSVPLHADCAKAQVIIKGQATPTTSDQATLEIDAVSASAR